MAIICNRDAEIGVTASLFSFNKSMVDYLTRQNDRKLGSMLNDLHTTCRPIRGAEYHQAVEINLS
jgi:aconitate hydratase